ASEHLALRERQGGAETRFRELGQLARHRVGEERSLDVVHTDAEELLVAKAAERIELRLAVQRRGEPRPELGRELLRGTHGADEIGADQAVEELRMTEEE